MNIGQLIAMLNEQQSKPVVNKSEKEKFFKLRDFVWGTLRNEIKEKEKCQKQLKAILKKSMFECLSAGHRKMLKENSRILWGLHACILALREGELDSRNGIDVEDFISEHFKRNQTFRRDYWKLWNKKFNN
jgi:hypothetical protein